jgi:formate dehydrogenase major subunit
MPGTNVAVLNAISHVVATEGLIDEALWLSAATRRLLKPGLDFIRLPENSPEALAEVTGVPAEACAQRRRRSPRR